MWTDYVRLAAMSKKLGFIPTFALITGVIIGSGILALPSILAQYGKFGFWAWPIASLAVLNLTFIFGYLSKKHPELSGLSDYIGHYFGKFTGFQISWSCVIGLCMGLAIVAIGFAGYTSSALGISNNIWLALSPLWLMLFIQIYCSIASNTSMIAITGFKILALALIVFTGLSKFDPSIMTAPSLCETGFVGLLSAVSIALFTFIGIESAALSGDKVANPSRTIPLATTISCVLGSLLFIGTYAVVWSVLPTSQLIVSAAPLADAAKVLMGNVGHKLIASFAIIGCLGSVQGCILCASVVLRRLATQGILPTALATSSKADFPTVSAIMCAVLSSVVVAIYYIVPTEFMSVVFKNAAQLEVFLAATVYLLSTMAYKLAGGNKFVFIVGFISCIAFLIGAMDDKLSCVTGVLGLLSSIPAYALANRTISMQ